MNTDGRRRGVTTRTQDFTVSTAPTCFYLYQVFPPGADGRPTPIKLENTVTIGRDPGTNAIVLEDAFVSRTHAELRRSSRGVWCILDNDSKNGTFVNGVRIRRCDLADGAVIRIGDNLFVFREVGLTVPPLLRPEMGFIAFAPAMRIAVEACRYAAPTPTTILLLGETGTGKEFLARLVHTQSGARGRFVPVNCAAISASLFESAFFGHRRGSFTGATADFAGLARAAEDGTLFLDEVGELPLEVQPKLLRFLETGELATIGSTALAHVSLRVVAATNADLATAVECGRFRRDLYARLAQRVVQVPPLRERPEDAVAIACRRLAELSASALVDVLEAVAIHDWPMNVRELLAVLQSAVDSARGGQVTLKDLPHPVRARVEPRRDERQVGDITGSHQVVPTAEELEALLCECSGNVSEVARRLSKDRRQVYRWIERYGLRPVKG